MSHVCEEVHPGDSHFYWVTMQKKAELVAAEERIDAELRHAEEVRGQVLEFFYEENPLIAQQAEQLRQAIDEEPKGSMVDRREKYAEAAFREEVAILATCVAGRNNQLNDSCFKLGTLVGAGLLEYNDVYNAMVLLVQRLHWTELRKTIGTIKSGLDAGRKKPRQLPV